MYAHKNSVILFQESAVRDLDVKLVKVSLKDASPIMQVRWCDGAGGGHFIAVATMAGLQVSFQILVGVCGPCWPWLPTDAAVVADTPTIRLQRIDEHVWAMRCFRCGGAGLGFNRPIHAAVSQHAE